MPFRALQAGLVSLVANRYKLFNNWTVIKRYVMQKKM